MNSGVKMVNDVIIKFGVRVRGHVGESGSSLFIWVRVWVRVRVRVLVRVLMVETLGESDSSLFFF